MKKTSIASLALGLLFLSAPLTVRADDGSDRPRSIVSISVCSPTATGTSVSCPSGSGDTRQPVLAPDGSFPLNNYGGLGTLADEHSTIFSPGTVPGHGDYLFFVATRTNLNSISSGVVVLTGGSGPDKNGQWTLDFAPDYGRYFPNNPAGQQNGQILLSPVEHRNCPTVLDAKLQDQTFDLNYADPGSVVLDPTNRANKGPGSLIMIYEGTNRCIGLTGGDNVLAGNSFYSTIAVATSNDFGHSWPSYRYSLDPNGLPLYPLPSQNPSTGPEAPSGATGNSVCIGNDCTAAPWPPDSNYGRYAVLHPQVTIADAMQNKETKGGLSNSMGDSVPSAFVDDVHAGDESDSHDEGHDPLYLYEVHNYAVGPTGLDFPQLPNGQNSDLMIARAQLNGGQAPLVFNKWYQGKFSEPGLGGFETSIFPNGAFENCEASGQLKTMGSISYVEVTQQYLLTFVCISPRGDPGSQSTGPGAAWFFSTNYDVSRQDQWSTPQEIVGSWSPFIDPKTTSCNDYDGWYPAFMSLDHKPGHLTTSGYVFYMKGCTGGGATPGGREFSTRAFTITTE